MRVSDLSDNMFNLLKMDSDSYIMNKTTEDICEFMRRLCAGYYDEAYDSGLEIYVDIPEEPIIISADYSLLSRAFGNLIEIADDGRPIEPEIRDTLFEAFSRADSARKTDGGSGLGLSIAKTIFDKHNWKIVYDYNYCSFSKQNNLKCNSFIIVTDKKGENRQ